MSPLSINQFQLTIKAFTVNIETYLCAVSIIFNSRLSKIC